ncbi:MAG: alcohol dehydrogenase catalytic domain-containing protein [Caulobacteraceae bacterium]
MKAAIFQGVHKPLVIESLPDPTPGPGDVVVKVGLCGICGSDLHISEDPIFGVPAGAVLGHEYSGEVVEVGSGVTTVRKGDRLAVFPLESCGACGPCRSGQPAWCDKGMVVGGGGYGQFSRVAEHQCVRMPSGVSLADGALVEPLAVSLHAVNVSEDALRGAGARGGRRPDRPRHRFLGAPDGRRQDRGHRVVHPPGRTRHGDGRQRLHGAGGQRPRSRLARARRPAGSGVRVRGQARPYPEMRRPRRRARHGG